MFSYMKALAYTDLMYLFMVIQICIFTVQARSAKVSFSLKQNYLTQKITKTAAAN